MEPITRLVYHVLQDRMAVFVVQPNGTTNGTVQFVGAKALQQKVTELRHALNVRDNARGLVLRDLIRAAPAVEQMPFAPLLRELYTLLIAPIDYSLPDDDALISLEPHGALWLLPFAALTDVDGRWLGDRYRLLWAFSAELQTRIRAEPAQAINPAPLLIGNPTMPDLSYLHDAVETIQPLPGAEKEAHFVADLLTTHTPTTLTGDNAHWLNVVARMPTHRILHFATHGLANAERPLESFIVLAQTNDDLVNALYDLDYQQQGRLAPLLSLLNYEGHRGLLTARQVQALGLSAELVVLSACQTGLGQIAGDGMIGLSRAFLIAGARSVLVSQWSVSDEATLLLMQHFYTAWLATDDRAEALRQAMIAVRADPRFTHPRFWAPFVLLGTEK